MSEGVLSGRRVLVVEDEYFIAVELERVLRAAGAAVLGPAPTVGAALDLLRSGAPEAAVLDINLGGEMAYPVADQLAASGVPFLFTTGYNRAALPAAHAEARRLEKPVEPNTILHELGTLLGPAASR